MGDGPEARRSVHADNHAQRARSIYFRVIRALKPHHVGPSRKSLPSGRVWPPSTTIVVPVI
jgi:hypothetical protein